MDVNISQRTQFHEMGENRRGIDGRLSCAKINPEISYAIRRQRVINGVDYLKPTTSKPPSQTEKGGNVHKIQNVSFDTYLPQFCLSSHLKTDKNQTRKTPVPKIGRLNRSKSSINLSTGRHLTSKSGLHNVVVTDLTCLQLADTLFSSNLSLGFTSESTTKLRFTNYTGEKRNSKNSATLPLPVLGAPERHGTDCEISLTKRKGQESTNYSRKENHRPNSSNTVKKMFQSSIFSEKDDVSPKSILKQNSVDIQPEITCKLPKYRTISEKRTRKNICQETHRCITLKASRIGLQSRDLTVKPCAIDVDDKDKRSVRFNISHEIFEYVPHEPVRI